MDPDQVDRVDPGEAGLVAETVGAVLSLSASVPRAVPGSDWLGSGVASRRSRVWVAVGMVSVELDLPAHDALAVLRGHAFARGATLDDLAEELVERTLPVDQLRG